MKRHRFKTLLTAGANFFAGTAAHAADWHVDASASPGGNGMSWGTAFNTLTAALNNFQLAPGDSIFVAEGTYSPGTQASSTFLIPSGVQVYGGFLIGETFGEQNPGAHISTLDGGGNVRHVVTIQDSSEASQTILSGFTITGGNANGPNNQSRSGGGVLVDNDADSAQITRCLNQQIPAFEKLVPLHRQFSGQRRSHQHRLSELLCAGRLHSVRHQLHVLRKHRNRVRWSRLGDRLRRVHELPLLRERLHRYAQSDDALSPKHGPFQALPDRPQGEPFAFLIHKN